MKPRFITASVLLAALLTPSLRAQDPPEKIREIEKKVLLAQYEKGIHSLAAAVGELQQGSTGTNPEALTKRLDWLSTIGGQLGSDDKMQLIANRQDMSGRAGEINDLAWNMLTSPDAAARRPEVALKLADIALELGSADEILRPKMLDTRARALFLLGRRDEAIAAQEMAVAAAVDPTEKPGFEATLSAYRKGEVPAMMPPAADAGAGPFGGAGMAAPAPEATLAEKDLRSRADDILRLKERIAAAGKELAGAKGEDIERAKEDLRKQMVELAQLTRQREREAATSGAIYILGKMRTIVIPTIDFKDATLEEVVDFLRKKSVELDHAEPDPGRKGVNIVVRATLPMAAGGGGTMPAEESPRIKDLNLRNIPLSEALKYICEATGYRYKVDDYAITLVSPNAKEDFFNRTFKVPDDFGSTLVPIDELLKLCGVKFDEGASAKLMPDGILIVRNTPTELDKIEQLIEADQAARARRNAPAGGAPGTPPGR